MKMFHSLNQANNKIFGETFNSNSFFYVCLFKTSITNYSGNVKKLTKENKFFYLRITN